MNKKTRNKKDSFNLIQDNVGDNLTPCELELLQLTQTTNALNDLVTKTGRKKPNIHKTAQRLIIKGLIDNHHGLYFISGYGIQVLKALRYPNPDGDWKSITPFRKDRERIRLHNVSFTVKFWHIPPCWDKLRGTVFGLSETEESKSYFSDLAREVSDFNNNPSFAGGGLQTLRFKDYTVICYASSIRVFIPEIISDLPDVAALEAWKSLISFLPKLERWLKIPSQSLWSNRRLNIKISTSHYAWFESLFAQYMVNEKGATRYLVKDSLGKQRLLVDRSQGHYETEAVDPLNGLADIELIGEIHRQYIEGEGPLPKEVKESLDEIGGQVINVNDALKDFAVNLQAHTGTAKANLIAADALNRALDRVDSIINLISWPLKLLGKNRNKKGVK